MLTLILILSAIIKCIAFFLFCLSTSYVVLYGKTSTGIRRDYIFTSMMLILTLMVTQKLTTVLMP